MNDSQFRALLVAILCAGSGGEMAPQDALEVAEEILKITHVKWEQK